MEISTGVTLLFCLSRVVSFIQQFGAKRRAKGEKLKLKTKKAFRKKKKRRRRRKKKKKRERERGERADSTAQPSPARWVVAGAGGIRWTPDGPQTQTDWKSKSRRE